jgi:hypothetical protein
MIVFLLAVFGMFFATLGMIEIAYRFGLRHWSKLPEASRNVSSTIEGSIFSLMALLIGFSFYGAGARFDNRRSIVGLEANTMSTAYLRLDLLPQASQLALRELFRQYVRCRIDVLNSVSNPEKLREGRARTSVLQHNIWDQAVAAAKESGPAVQTLVVSSLNEMIDITTTSAVAAMTHPPLAVFLMLFVSIAASAGVIGYSAAARRSRDWVSIAAFALILSAAVYVTIDYEYPRFGLIRIDPIDRVLTNTLDNMK